MAEAKYENEKEKKKHKVDRKLQQKEIIQLDHRGID